MKFRAITGTLKLRTALHVGTGQGAGTADDLLRRDARGRLLVPGTALAGALRSIATRLAPRLLDSSSCVALTGENNPETPCQCAVCRLFGTVNPRDVNRDPQESEEQWLGRTGCATGVVIYDAILASAGVMVRDGVGIDRATGAAARRERAKFDLEVLPAGCEFKLRVELDRRLEDEDAVRLLAATLAEWQAGRGAIGGRAAAGLGAFELCNVRFAEHDLDQPETLMAFLRSGPRWDVLDGDATWLEQQIRSLPAVAPWCGDAALPVARSWALAEFTLAATGLFLVNDSAQAGRSGFDHAPLLDTYTVGEKPLPANARLRGQPVLPGSSLRGVLRSQAERIARTLVTLQAWDSSADPGQRRSAFLQRCPACNPLARKDGEDASCSSLVTSLPTAERDRLERQGAEDHLCLACRLFGSTWNGSRLRVEDAPCKEGVEVAYKVLDFLAIDRFTGGGRDSAKFDALALWQPRFAVRLYLENPQAWELGWLALALRDVHDGLATVGFGRAKGFGECRIRDLGLALGVLNDQDLPLPAAPPAGAANEAALHAGEAARAASERLLAHKGAPSGVFQTVVYDAGRQADWLALAQGWVLAFHQELASRPRPVAFPLAADSYFTGPAGPRLPELYPARVNQ
jgi:CRISPR/Cas system CSM-associated protein Csm3 (group 7 of RAMP superfamily)